MPESRLQRCREAYKSAVEFRGGSFQFVGKHATSAEAIKEWLAVRPLLPDVTVIDAPWDELDDRPWGV